MTTPVRLRGAEETAFRRQFEMDAVWSRMIAPGGRVPAMPLIEVDLGPIHLDLMLRTGPIVLVFFPYAGPASCDDLLAGYQRTLLPPCTSAGAHLVAVSPQRPDLLAPLKHRLDLGYLVASDPRHILIDAFGIGYRGPEASEVLGTGRAVLPYPAVVVADRTGTVRYASVRPEAAPPTPAARIIAALDRLVPAPSGGAAAPSTRD
ncbi:redoxin domain-containing protein [Amorphoplanes digitatis]|uniref:Peroxiredoxin n=1 Tax=Actinoplanes digitatis TaxID=1868 RepID=A0A7W7HXV2_9ACTN|nr:redoxin domain-containing protein [Actinoplanes digitatis]MBB4762701.1 peroxiredoxin [Actinoplanes digitatis]